MIGDELEMNGIRSREIPRGWLNPGATGGLVNTGHGPHAAVMVGGFCGMFGSGLTRSGGCLVGVSGPGRIGSGGIHRHNLGGVAGTLGRNWPKPSCDKAI